MRIHATEAETQKAILELLAAHNIFAFRLNTAAFKVGKRFFRAHSLGPGAADILAILNWNHCNMCGQIVSAFWIECKSADGKQTPEQKNFQQHVESLGHWYVVAKSQDDVIKYLKDEGAL